MDFGMRLVEGGSDFEGTVEHARAAEDHGLDAVYLAEHSGFPDSPYWSEPIVALSGVAAATDRVRVGTHIALLPLYNPVRLAGMMAQLDIVSNGRACFGFGVGWREHEFDVMNEPFDERGPRTTEYLKLVDALLRGGDSFDGRFVSFEDFELSQQPVQDPRPPIYIGGFSDPAIRRGVELCDGWVSPGGDLEGHTSFVDEFRERGGGRVVVGSEGLVVREDREEALRDAREFLKNRRRPHVREGNRHMIGEFEAHLDDRGEALPRDTPEAVEEYVDRLVEWEIGGDVESYLGDTIFFAGTPEMVVEQVERVVAETNPDELIFRPFVQGVSDDDLWTSTDLLGEEVLPELR